MWQKLPPWVLERIFKWVDRNIELTRLARVCKSWSLVAIDVLWTKCDDLTHLLPTLPNDLLQSIHSGILEFAREPRAEDLRRFIFYSHRIQQLHYYHQLPTACRYTDSSVLLKLHHCHPTLFPNLRRLCFASGNADGWKTLRCLVSPRLAQLVLYFRSGLAGEHVQLHTVAVHNACLGICDVIKGSLKTLVIKSSRQDETILAPVFADMMQHLPKLRKVQMPLGGPLLSSSFRHLCQMKDLVILDVRVYVASYEDVERLHNTMPPNPFQSLRTMHLESTISFYLPIIRLVQSNALNNLRLLFKEQCPLPTESFSSLIQATCSASSSLQVFDLTIQTPPSRRLSSNLPTAAVLLPLFAHRKLQELVVDLGVPIQLTDADMETIACMWPKLWKLRLVASTRANKCVDYTLAGNEGWKPLATCRAIMALFYHLRHLTELAVEFDASTLDELAAHSRSKVGGEKTMSIQTSNLKLFDVGCSLPGRPLCVGSWVAIMCPNLQELQWNGENEGWERTCEVLLRIQERESL
ncbi:hypothetical protein M408DRAFT_18970 [Serendipita vermifera MAFF 305830]|uniref:F-box domain-containing protein n=1 Tax=Serendipita vermifera MAFF 305830 TaxID=933852 RepID=A0A0C3BRB2_SERVB|nr:hypothetical protein M408DRAFT_18970 [Serendipita vermifera MAFF 305830]